MTAASRTASLRRVTVATSGDRPLSVNAYLYGEWAAHRAIVGKGWTVTYLPSGRAVSTVGLPAAKAKKLAGALHALIARQEMLDWAALKPTTARKIHDALRAAGVS